MQVWNYTDLITDRDSSKKLTGSMISVPTVFWFTKGFYQYLSKHMTQKWDTQFKTGRRKIEKQTNDQVRK